MHPYQFCWILGFALSVCPSTCCFRLPSMHPSAFPSRIPCIFCCYASWLCILPQSQCPNNPFVPCHARKPTAHSHFWHHRCLGHLFVSGRQHCAQMFPTEQTFYHWKPTQQVLQNAQASYVWYLYFYPFLLVQIGSTSQDLLLTEAFDQPLASS